MEDNLYGIARVVRVHLLFVRLELITGFFTKYLHCADVIAYQPKPNQLPIIQTNSVNDAKTEK